MNFTDSTKNIFLHAGDALDAYGTWPSPVCIISDGPYGISGYPGDSSSPSALPDIYEPHIRSWTAAATSHTTLWFWNTEVGWASVHPVLEACGWIYRSLNIWDKGVGHIAGNCNGKTMRKFPVVTEVCAHYIREPEFMSNGRKISLQDWFRAEWKRTGLPFSRANEACGVRNAASRKYLTSDHLWYAPPADVFAKLALYANLHGKSEGRPYFDLNSDEVSSTEMAMSKWEKLQSVFNFEYGVTNVWNCPANRGRERIRNEKGGAFHSNQKPESLLRRIIAAGSNPGDVVWDVFCGSGSGALVASLMNRPVYTAEINPLFSEGACSRLGLIPQ